MKRTFKIFYIMSVGLIFQNKLILQFFFLFLFGLKLSIFVARKTISLSKKIKIKITQCVLNQTKNIKYKTSNILPIFLFLEIEIKKFYVRVGRAMCSISSTIKLEK